MQGVDALEAYFARYLPQVVLASVVPLACWPGWRIVDLDSALIMLLTLPLVPVFMWLIGRHTEQRTRERWQALRALSTHFLDVVRGLPTLRAFNRGEAQAARSPSVSERYRRATMGTLRVSFLSGAVLELAATLGVALVAVTVGVRLVDGGLGFAGRADRARAGPRAVPAAPATSAPQFHASADGLAVAGRMLELLDAPPSARAGGTAAPPSPALGAGALRGGVVRLPGAPRARARRASTSSCCPARRSRSWARAARARARSPRCCSACSTRPRAG